MNVMKKWLIGSIRNIIVWEDLTDTKNICRRYGCPLEFILKDISTVRSEPERLKKWADIAMAAAAG